jgi:hypothetical protein
MCFSLFCVFLLRLGILVDIIRMGWDGLINYGLNVNCDFGQTRNYTRAIFTTRGCLLSI